MSDELRKLAYDVFDLLTSYVAVHDEQLAGASLIKPIDFGKNAGVLRSVSSGIEQARLRSAELRVAANQAHRSYLDAMDSYLDCLADTVSRFTAITEKLASKAQGQSYGFWAYRSDMKGYKASAVKYQTQGATLKRAWDVAGL